MAKNNLFPKQPGPGSDTTAIHDDVSGEIAVITKKDTPVAADVIVIEDSESTDVKKRVELGDLPGGGAADRINDTADTTYVDTDEVADKVKAVGKLGIEINSSDQAIAGDIKVTAGDSTGSAQVGGDIDIDAGGGGDSGAGGLIDIKAGAGGSNGAGGIMNLAAGVGGSNVAGGAINITSGQGGQNAGGGVLNITAGQGGGSGVGGVLNLKGGAGAADFNGGNINIIGGTTSSANAANSGTIAISTTTGAGSGNSGDILLQTGVGGAGSGGDAGNITLTGGACGVGGDSAGDITAQAGAGNGATAGGAISLTAGVGGGDGGPVSLTSGNATGNKIGGAITLSAGTGAGSGVKGGAISITAGAAIGGGGNGGPITIIAGTGHEVGAGGILKLKSGNGGGSGAGGAIIIDTGIGASGGAITIGGTNTVTTTIGNLARSARLKTQPANNTVPLAIATTQFVIDNAGGGKVALQGFIDGDAYVAENIIWLRATKAFTLAKVRIGAATAPTGSGTSLTMDVNYHATDPDSATTIFTTQANRPSIVLTNHTDDSGTPDVTAIADGGWFGICTDIIGDVLPGSKIVVELLE